MGERGLYNGVYCEQLHKRVLLQTIAHIVNNCTLEYIANNCTMENIVDNCIIAYLGILQTMARLHNISHRRARCTDAHIVEEQGLPLKAPWVTVGLGEILR